MLRCSRIRWDRLDPGGFLIGLGETALVAAGYSTFSDAFTFVILIVVLLVRPTGLFGEKTTNKV